ncbi:DUF4232 domain-containing protein [Streptomyces telluris]|uniref:DUF4232 domain-containing protein n=1 Tax=Streptomyces telluris TaxID=2720021 RepID=A0A9X2LM17_9ACTN|nr:DUF4232 domain-containing protein [Streptomyces telluris]MCQ8773717.1 DUF4232 domain-containing protein [Streptomyces telluris]NJP76870.1 DUF4232 domain-containing protein [Streptomyces telluris]
MRHGRALRLAGAALTVTAALGLTACGGDGGKDDGKGNGKGAAAASPSGDAAEAPSVDDGKPQDKGDACGPGDLTVEARKAPGGRLLLVATNTGAKPCTAYGFPFLRFDQDQATAGVGEESKPKAPVKVAPGKAAYAGVTPTAADGSGGPGRDVKKLSVTFQTAGGDPLPGDPAAPALPGGSLHVDDQARATYWVDGEAAALKG